MPDTRPNDVETLTAELERVRQELEVAQETLRAIRNGEVDAVVIEGGDEPTVLTLGAAEQTYQLIVDQVSHPTALLAPDGRILQSNALFAALVQYDSATLKDTLIQDIVVPSSVGAIEALLEEGARREAERELILRNAAGQRIPVSFGIRPLKDNLTGPCLLLTDLTAERARERIVSEEILAQSILEQVGDAVIVCDPSGRIVRTSRAVETLIGGDPVNRFLDEALPLKHLVDGELQPFAFRALLDAPELRGREAVLQWADGRLSHVILTTGFLFDKAGEVRGAVLTLTDITDRKRVESALELADRRKNEFLAILAHELRNPLAPISNGIRLLASGKARGDVQEEALGLMARQVHNMVRLVDDLMDVSRITRGKIELRRERLKLADILRVAEETSQPIITQFDHTLTAAPVDDDLWVEGDFTRLSQVFSNLLNNAAKYSDRSRTIAIDAEVHDGAVDIHVSDQGIGIRPEMIDRIFDMFAQVDDSLERSHGGLGVGLTLVRNLVEMHGGAVSVASEGLGKGSRFTIRLPLMPAPANDAEAPVAVTAGTDGLKILIVEDNPALAQTSGWLVEAMGHDYRIAHNGADALAVAPDYRPDVVMLDIGLPGMNGYDICRAMRQEPALASTLFIAQTGWGQSEHKAMAEAAGFHHHMVKPVDYEKLQQLLAVIK